MRNVNDNELITAMVCAAILFAILFIFWVRG